MQIGEIIRKYRKERELTQEEMANRLGVTAPAVNKWEKGASQPDISLLAPIARLLGITLETLLSFHENLTEEEIAQIIKEIDRKFERDSYGEVFQYAVSLINRYPNCYQLIWQLAVVLDAKCHLDGDADSQIFEKQIEDWYVRALESEDEQLRRNAAGSLFQLYLGKEEYEKAERYMQYFSEESAERKRKQAVIYSRTGRREEACKTYEEILFSEYQMMDMVMNSLFMLSMEVHDLERAKMWVEKESGLARLFDMGIYREESCKLELAVEEKEVQQTFLIARALLETVEARGLTSFSQSDMYTHMSFREAGEDFYQSLAEDLRKGFQEETFAYMEDHAGWRELFH